MLDPVGLETAVYPLNLVQPTGIEPVSTGLQSAAMTTSAKVALKNRMLFYGFD